MMGSAMAEMASHNPTSGWPRRPWLKCDAADHHLDHGAVWPLDPCYDLAGTCYEWALRLSSDCLARARYIEESADWPAPERLPFYHAVYCAALLGQHDMAYHLEEANPAEAARYDHARRRYAEGLRAALLTAEATVRSSDGAVASRVGQEQLHSCHPGTARTAPRSHPDHRPPPHYAC